MASMPGKLALVIAAAGGLGLAALSPTSVEARVIRPSLGLAAATGDSDVVRIRCVRSISNLWSCNDDVRSHPCDHANQTARDGSRCGNRAADRRRGGGR
jgi:hypothetical protein